MNATIMVDIVYVSFFFVLFLQHVTTIKCLCVSSNNVYLALFGPPIFDWFLVPLCV